MSKNGNNMGLKKTKRTEKTFNTGLPWSNVDVERLIKLYPKSHDKNLAILFGRAPDGVRGKARQLGLKKDYAGGYKPNYSWGTGWSTEEISLLRKLYPTTSNHDIAEILGRSFASVKGQAQQLKLKKMECWSQEETIFLKTHYQKMSNAKLAQQLGRTEGAVMSQLRMLALKHRVEPWENDELGVLKKYYHKTNGNVLARMLGRSYEAVRMKASLLGLSENRCWSPQENKILKELYHECTLAEIAEKVGRTTCAVKRHAQSIGLRKVAS